MEGRIILKRWLTGLGIALVLGYSCFAFYDLVRGPRILIDEPISGFSTTSPLVVISGRTIHSINLTVNDAQTAVDLAGNFHTQLILAPGYNIITVAAKDTYGRTARSTIEIVLRTPLATSTPAEAQEEHATTTADTDPQNAVTESIIQ